MTSLQIAKWATSLCQRDEIGIHRGFKIPRLNGRVGSSPTAGTIIYKTLIRKSRGFFMFKR